MSCRKDVRYYTTKLVIFIPPIVTFAQVQIIIYEYLLPTHSNLQQNEMSCYRLWHTVTVVNGTIHDLILIAVTLQAMTTVRLKESGPVRSYTCSAESTTGYQSVKHV